MRIMVTSLARESQSLKMKARLNMKTKATTTVQPKRTRDVKAIALAITKLEAAMDGFKDIEDLDTLTAVDLDVLLAVTEAICRTAASVTVLCRAGIVAEQGRVVAR